MLRVLVLLALIASVPGCRKVARSVEPAAPPAAAPSTASAPPAPTQEDAAPAATVAAPAPAAAPAAATTAASAPAAAPPTAGDLAVPPSLGVQAAVPAAVSPPAAPDDEADDALYSWTDDHGTLHFSSGGDVPDDRRRSARRVGGGITVVPAPVVDAPARTANPSSDTATGAPATDQPRRPVKGPTPELDAQGLPIPGTMDETSHTLDVKRATGVSLDPASVERRYRQQLRDMNCREENGVVTCG